MGGVARNFDNRELRQVLGSFVTGVTVITTLDGQGRPHGLTANSFSSVSLDPPLILWSQSNTAPSQAVFNAVDRFAVNILADDQVEVSNRFARPAADKFAGLPHAPGLGGVPLLAGCAAHLECRRVQSYPGGDHTVFIGEVESIARHPRQPLVFGSGRYLVAQPHDMGPLVELSDELDETLGIGVWGNKGPTIVRWEESPEPVSDNLRTGLVLPVLTSATGLAFAAWLPRELTAPLVDAEMSDGADQFHPDAGLLSQRLAQVRAQGYVRLVGTDDFAELYGASISAVSVPVFDHQGAMVLAFTAIGALDLLDVAPDGRLLTRMRECARDLGPRLQRLAVAAAHSAA